MNRFQNLQNKLQSTVQGINANITDGATKLRQQLAENVQSSALLGSGSGQLGSGPTPGVQQQPPATPGGSGEQQFLKLPVESAKKLRWFDRQDLGMLIDLHLREKQELYDANAALRKVMERKGINPKQLDEEVQEILATVDTIRSHDAAVNEVMVLSAKAELEAEAERCSELAAKIESLEQKLQQQAGPLSPSRISRQPSSLLKTPSKEGGEGAATAAIEQVDDGNDDASQLRQALQTVVNASTDSVESVKGDDGMLFKAASRAIASASNMRLVENQSDAAAVDGTHDDASTAASNENVALLEEKCAQLESELSAARNDIAYAKEAAEKKLTEVRSKFSTTQQAQQDLLRVAQDKRLEAESRFEATEAKYVAAETALGESKAKVAQLEEDVKRLEKVAADAEEKLSHVTASAEKNRIKGAQQADANVQQVLNQHRARVSELEAALKNARQQLANEQSKTASLETRLANAEMATAKATMEVRELENSVTDRDAIALQLAATQARLDEVRSEQANAENLRSLATQSEARRAQAEEELVTTAKLAATLESRLADALAEIQNSKISVDSAVNRAREAEAAIKLQVAKEWELAGSDRHRWPPAAQAELENVEARLKALNASLASTEKSAKEAAEQRDAALAAKEEAGAIAAAAKAQADRLTKEAGQREQRLQAAAAAALQQVNEFRAALAKAERERDRLMVEKQAREEASKAAAAAVAAAKRRGGGGSLSTELSEVYTPEKPASRSRSNSDASEIPSTVLHSPFKGRETLHSTDIIYLKNVLLKFINAFMNSRYQECEVLLPAVAAILQANPAEFHVLKESLNSSSGLGWIYSSLASAASTTGATGTAGGK